MPGVDGNGSETRTIDILYSTPCGNKIDRSLSHKVFLKLWVWKSGTKQYRGLIDASRQEILTTRNVHLKSDT